MVDLSQDPKGAFAKALAKTSKGDKIVYWTGETCGGPHRNDAMLAEANGAVALVQKRLNSSIFQYIAQRR